MLGSIGYSECLTLAQLFDNEWWFYQAQIPIGIKCRNFTLELQVSSLCILRSQRYFFSVFKSQRSAIA